MRVLRSGVKLAQQPGGSSWSPPAPAKSERQKLDNSLSLRDSHGPFILGVSFRRGCWDYWEYGHELHVDMNSWVSVLCSVEDFTRSGTELQVRVRAVLVSEDEDLTFPAFHLIRLAGASLASYQQDSQGSHSVIFPVSCSAATCRRIKFTRSSSDLGREVKVVFSLEDGGLVVGRRTFSVKIRPERTPETPVIEL